MKYDNGIVSFDRFSSLEILQYAVGPLLYTPATRDLADSIISGKHPDYRSLCLDLEDAVGDDNVETAERALFNTLIQFYEAESSGKMKPENVPLIFIRVRTPEHFKHMVDDVLDDRCLHIITGFNFPKFDTTNMDAYIRIFLNIKADHKLYFMPILESQRIMFKQYRTKELCAIRERLKQLAEQECVLNIRVGATDFCSLFALRRPVENTIYDIDVVSDCLIDIINMFEKNYVVSGPVWEYYGKADPKTGEWIPGKWSDGLQREIAKDKLQGFIGKTTIHPSHLKYVQDAYMVKQADLENAGTILGNNCLVGVIPGKGEKQMLEVKPHTRWARRIQMLANVYGVREE